jgi:eukaryotic-like serine/threonine-protein kinase
MGRQNHYKIGDYEVTGVVGRGRMATVYRGFQASLNRPVAIKLLSQKLSDKQQIVRRFNRASLIIARLMHPNIIHVIDRGLTKEGRPFFVMDLVKGTNLSKVILSSVPPLNKKYDLILQICKGLSYAHKSGVIHRDIKPENILIDIEGNAVLRNFTVRAGSRSNIQKKNF